MFKDKKQLAICLLTVLMVGCFVIFRYLPLRNKLKAVKQIRDEQKLTIDKGISDNVQLPVIQEQLLSLRTELEDYEKNIPQQNALGLFVQQISELMNQYDLNEEEITPRSENHGEDLYCIPVSIHCKGQLSQIYDFYKELQELDRLVRVELVRLENDSSYSGIVSLATDIVIYYKPEMTRG